MSTRTHTAPAKDPKGGLTSAGRRMFRLRDGSHLRPGVTGKADTLEKMRRKGSFLRRMFTHPRGPMVRDGKPTRLALSAHAWGEPVPKTLAAAKKLARKGEALLKRYGASKKMATKKAAAKKLARKKPKHSLVENINRRKAKGASRPKSRSTVSKEAYREMREGWGTKKKGAARKRQVRSDKRAKSSS